MAANLTTMMIDDKTETSRSYHTIKLGIDAHAKWYHVARQLDGATPQPGYHARRKWMAVLGDARRSAAGRKKAIVAVARQLAVDLWRLFTGQTCAENWA